MNAETMDIPEAGDGERPKVDDVEGKLKAKMTKGVKGTRRWRSGVDTVIGGTTMAQRGCGVSPAT